METTYSDYVTSVACQNPSLKTLSDFLRRQPRTACNSVVSYVEIEKNGDIGPSQEISTSGLATLVNSGLTKNVMAVVENIHPDDIDALGLCLDVNPFFFAGHIASSYGNIENTPLPPLSALLPSRLITWPFFNIHHQKVLDFGDESTLGSAPYELVLSANVTRRVRRLPALSGRSIGLLHACSSMIKKDLPGNVWISVFLVDSDSDIVTHSTRNNSHILGSRITQIPRRIGVEAFCDPPTYTESQSLDTSSARFQPLNPRQNLLSFFRLSPPRWKARNPSILSLAYYPIQTVLQEWMLYGSLMGRYVKYYEYSFKTVPSRLDNFEKHDILELHRWRRRSLQSLHKLQIVRHFVEHWASKEDNFSLDELFTTTPTTREESSTLNLLQADIKYCEDQVLQHSRSLEALNPIITALVQLMDSHKSISQAEDVRRLTYIAMAFIPLTFITGIFSMSEPYGPGSDRFWIYWTVALPTAAFVMGVLALDGRFAALFALFAHARKRVAGSSSPV